jgi:hypothetical protein
MWNLLIYVRYDVSAVSMPENEIKSPCPFGSQHRTTGARSLSTQSAKTMVADEQQERT